MKMEANWLHLGGQEVFEGKTFDLGILRHSAEEIIEFAQFVDPLPMHTDPEAAKSSIFGGLIGSGAMLYIAAHRKWFIPMFGPSIVCGLGIRNWNFSKPHFPDTPYLSHLTARQLQFNPQKGMVQIDWYYEFFAPDGSKAQDLELPVLHWIDV